MNKLFFLTVITGCLSFGCQSRNTKSENIQKATVKEAKPAKKILTGAEQTEKYIPLLKGKKVGLVINPTAQINGVSLADTLLARGVAIKAIFGPEHGFRGDADAGEKVGNYIDKKSGLPVISLYGKKQAPAK